MYEKNNEGVKQFIETSTGDFVNLKAVSNIVFDEHWTDRFGNHKPKIIYNFDYPVSLPRSNKKVVDYKYDIFEDLSEFKRAVEQINNLVNKLNWIAPVVNGEITKVINPDKISFMTSDDNNQRIILNLKSSISFHGDYNRLTSDFVYITHNYWDEYVNNLNYIRGLLKLKEF